MNILRLFLLFLNQSTIALIYNNKCNDNCDVAGMICFDNRCICDYAKRLFWTKKRCTRCPDDWIMTETNCMMYSNIEMTWEQAKLTCRKQQAELISLKNQDIIPVLYNIMNEDVAWTSARTIDLSKSGMYQWLDEDLHHLFNNQSDWWCKNVKSKSAIDETNACVILRKDTNSNPFVCLDDQLCSQKFGFICEKSEQIENQHLLAGLGLSHEEALRADIVHTIPSHVGTVIVQLAGQKSSFMSTGGIIILMLVLIVILLANIGAVLYLRRKSSIVSRNQTVHPRKSSVESIQSDNEQLQQPPPIFTFDTITEKTKKSGKGGTVSQQIFDDLD